MRGRMMTVENAAFAADMPDAPRATGWLAHIERVGNALPDPAMLSVGMIALLRTGAPGCRGLVNDRCFDTAKRVSSKLLLVGERLLRFTCP